MKSVHATAPTRIDLAGAGLDLWPLYLAHPGAVCVSLSISRLARARITPRPDRRVVLRSLDTGASVDAADVNELSRARSLPLLRAIVHCLAPQEGFNLSVRSGVPLGSGLGGASSVIVAALRALSLSMERRLSREEIVALAQDVESAVAGFPVGVSGHFAAAYGGVSALELEPGRIDRESLLRDPSTIARHVVLATVGQATLTTRAHWEAMRDAIDGRETATRCVTEIAAAARAMREAVLGGRVNDAAAAMEREAAARRELTPGVETAEVLRVRQLAQAAGALGVNVCGPGGGGGIVVLVPVGRKARVTRALRSAGAKPIVFRPDTEGLRP